MGRGKGDLILPRWERSRIPTRRKWYPLGVVLVKWKIGRYVMADAVIYSLTQAFEDVWASLG
jgi:hypothetical protein